MTFMKQKNLKFYKLAKMQSKRWRNQRQKIAT